MTQETPCEQPQLREARLADVSSKKVAAGVLGILLGSLGIHKLVLGYSLAGGIMLGTTILGTIAGGCCGWTLVLLPCIAMPTIMHIIGLIEGILYLTKTDQQFYDTYVVGKREWF
ncbi:MAG: TM2 domain-containing protein [Phycisphaerales bacterium]|nr:TM2 domain-containing protein [Phycisphaerales bacterium]